jgi:hypothetical protein
MPRLKKRPTLAEACPLASLKPGIQQLTPGQQVALHVWMYRNLPAVLEHHLDTFVDCWKGLQKIEESAWLRVFRELIVKRNPPRRNERRDDRIEQLKREGKQLGQIIRAMGLNYKRHAGMVRAVLYRARKAGRLPGPRQA